MHVESEEINRLETCISDLISLVALPAKWIDSEPRAIAESLSTIAIRMLRLDFAHVELEPKPEMASGALRTARFPICGTGSLIAGSRRVDFPTVIESLLLRVAANQATLALQEAQRARNLEHRVDERTRELIRSEGYLAEGQRLTHTGSWAENKITGEVFWSEEMFRIFGYEPGTRITFEKILNERIHPDDRARFMQTAETALRERQDIDLEHRIVFPDGSIRFHHVVAHPVVDQVGRVVEIVGTTMDVTERTVEMETLHRAQADLAHMTRVTTMGELCASIAHEVNQPLAAVVTNGNASLRWLNASPPDLREVREATERIIADANRASDVVVRVRGLLTKKASERVALDVNKVIEEVLTLTEGERRGHDVVVETHLQPDLSSVSADPIQLQQVILNLILNAIEAMRMEPRRRALLIASSADGSGGVVVTIKDSGCGIAPENRERIFEPFYSTKNGGLGMGLAISRSIIESHTGHLWMTQEPEGGSVFHFTLPAAT